MLGFGMKLLKCLQNLVLPNLAEQTERCSSQRNVRPSCEGGSDEVVTFCKTWFNVPNLDASRARMSTLAQSAPGEGLARVRNVVRRL